MRQIERSSIARIISDLIKADSIIDIREIEFLDVLRRKYAITKADEALAESCTWANALKTIAAFDDSVKHALMNDFNQVAMSDGFCAKEEALLLLCLRFMLSLKISNEVSVFSVDSSVLSFENSQILYLESEYDKTINEQIGSLYREVSVEARLSGFELVYLPKMSEHYCSIMETDLLKIVGMLYPKVSEERLQVIVRQIQNLTTASFCNDQLAAKLAIKELRSIHPSFLIKIGKSTVCDKEMSNFLLVGIDENPLYTIRKIMDFFAENYHNFSLNYIREEKGRIIFTGYHKQIFDILVLCKGIRSPIVLDPHRERIYFPDADVQIEKIHRREKALYALFVVESASGGINFNKPKSVKQMERHKKRMREIMRKYQLIYRMFGGEEDKAPNIEIAEIRLPMISLLKKQLAKLGNSLYQVDDYMITRNVYGNYAVNIPSSLCCCSGIEKDDIKQLTESEDWIRIAAL